MKYQGKINENFNKLGVTLKIQYKTLEVIIFQLESNELTLKYKVSKIFHKC